MLKDENEKNFERNFHFIDQRMYLKNNKITAVAVNLIFYRFLNTRFYKLIN